MKSKEHSASCSCLIFGVGNALLDLIINADENLLKKYGLKNNDAIVGEARHLPLYDEIIENYNVEYSAGGSTQNTLRVAQWILQKPMSCVFMGAIGLDEYGSILKQKAEEGKIRAFYQCHKNYKTGRCAVLVTNNGKDRSLCADLGACNFFTKDLFFSDENWYWIQNANCYYISGFFLPVNLEAALLIAKCAKDNKKPFCLNLSANFICNVFKNHLLHIFPYVDVLFGNADEAAELAKVLNFNCFDIKEIIQEIYDFIKKNFDKEVLIIITQAANNIIALKDNSICEYPVPQLPLEQILDTNGAGDAFVGAQYVQMNPFEMCIKCAIWASQQVIQQSGCTFPTDMNFLY